jgi:cell shape-determining protein MreC
MTLVVTLVLALLPTQWLTPWTGDLAGVASMPLAPFGEAGSDVAAFLRGPRDPLDELSDDARKRLEDAEAERERFARLYRAAELRIMELEEQMATFVRLQLPDLNAQVTPVEAAVISRQSDDPHGIVYVNHGPNAGVTANSTIAVYGAGYLLARVVAVERLRTALQPLTNRATGYLRAAVIPAGDQTMSFNNAAIVHLKPGDDGLLYGDADRTAAIAQGDVVCLSDPTWPATAQARVIGHVESIAVKDEQPLRNIITVRPKHFVRDVSKVVLLVERSSESLATGDAP